MIAENIQNDWRKADLTEAEYAMLEWTEKISLTPALCTEEDVQKMRDVGWAERDIVDIANVCAYFNFRVRLVDSLGLELREAMVEYALEHREHAAELAAKRGSSVPIDAWGLTEKETATARH